MDDELIQKYQRIKANHRQAEINMARAKAQVDVYKKDIEEILASEQVSSIEELSAKYKEKQEELKTISSVLEKETAIANEVLSKLGVN